MYVDHYGFQKNPFENTPDPLFFYSSDHHKEALSALNYAVENDKGLIVIYGEVGTGKTTLIKTYIQNLSEQTMVFYVDYPFVTMKALLMYLADKLGVAFQEQNIIKLTEAILDKLFYLSKEGKKVVLVLDEAQDMDIQSLEYIRLLSNMQTKEKKLLNIVLVGQMELLPKINSSELKQLKQRIAIQRFLKPLTLRETVNYINYRLLVVGCHENPFTESALKLIYKRSGGIPRLINKLCDNGLLAAYVEGKRKVDTKTVKRVLREEDTSDKSQLLKKYLLTAAFLLAFLALTLFVFYDPFKIKEQHAPGLMSDPYLAKPQRFIGDFYLKVDAPYLKESLEEDDDHESSKELSLIDEKKLKAIIKEVPFVRNVESRETVLKILKETYGKSNDTIIDMFYAFNPSIKDIDRIFPGQKLILPKLDARSFIMKDREEKYFIHYYSSFDIKAAHRKLQEIGKLKYPMVLVTVAMENKNVYRIYVGPFLDINGAEQVLLYRLPRDHLPF